MFHPLKKILMMRFRYIIFIITALLTNKSASIAQQTFSLNNCIAVALENNYSVKIIKNRQVIASNNFTKAYAGMLPTVDLSSQYLGSLYNINQNYSDGSSQLSKAVYNSTVFTGLKAGWTVFDGFKAKTRYLQLEELKSIAELNTRISIENIIADLSSEYYFYVQQLQLLRNIKYSVDLSKERLRIEQEHFLLGSGSKLRLLQAQVNLNADSSRLERQYELLKTSQVRIAKLMALEDLNINFLPTDTVININSNLQYEELFNDVETNNSIILTAIKNKLLSQHELKIIKARQYPYFVVSAGYGYTYNTYQSGILNSNQSLGPNYGLSFGINLFDGNNRRREQVNAKIEIENAEYNYELIKQDNTAKLITLYNAYSNNLNLLQLEMQNLEAARENIEIAFERYRLGALSGFELREIQKNLLEAEERLLQVQYQAKIAEISLLQLSGRIINMN